MDHLSKIDIPTEMNDLLFRDSNMETDDLINKISDSFVKNVETGNEQKYLYELLSTKLFPHIGISPEPEEIILFLSVMLKKLILTITKQREVDDIDSMYNKRIETTGVLCHELLGMMFKKFIGTIKSSIKNKKKTNIKTLFTVENNINNMLHMAFATGNWGIPKSNYIRPGVSQVIMRYCYLSYLAHMRRIMIPGGKENKNIAIRKVHSSQFGYICPNETPEGQQCGLVLNFALMTVVSEGSNPLNIETILSNYLNKSSNLYDTIIFIDGKIIGSVNKSISNKIVCSLIEMRDVGTISYETSISYNSIENEIHIRTDSGRCLRPFLTISNGKLNIEQETDLKWNNLVQKGYIKYYDVNEIKNKYVATSIENMKMYPNRKYDLCEIHPSVVLGVLGNSIPFANHNPSPRNTYQCNMGKQAIGTPLLSYKNRADTSTHIMNYNQKPLVNSEIARYLKLDELPSGNNVVVAILSHTGYNQEDSIIMNKASIEKGLFQCTTLRTIIGQERNISQNNTEYICLPPPNNVNQFKRKFGNYSKLDSNGIIKRYEEITLPCGKKIKKKIVIKQGDVVIGRIIKKRLKDGTVTNIDTSIIAAKNEEGYIDNIFSTKTSSGYKLIKVVIRKQRIPEIGDKFASRSAQKGVVGMIYEQDKMPFNKDGICPDIIINPHCIPSRMTMNQLMECVFGKYCCHKGELGDATVFNKYTAYDICNMLKEEGMKENVNEDHGWEYLRDGFTGKKLKCKVFMGPTYYQRLKHMVSDKVYARTTGNYTTFMRQPVEGRSRDGGLKFGEMERDCMLAHGTTHFIKEKLFNNSDVFHVNTCKQCGSTVNNMKQCDMCLATDFVKCDFPYASKVLTHELSSMGIKVNLMTC